MKSHTYTVVLQRFGVLVSRVTVAARAAYTSGHWDGDNRFSVDLEALADMMPPNYRGAVLSGVFWQVADTLLPLRADLRGCKGQPMGTLYAFPDWIPEAGEAGLPASLRGEWKPFHKLALFDTFALSSGVVYRKHSATLAKVIKGARGVCIARPVAFTKWQSVCKVQA